MKSRHNLSGFATEFPLWKNVLLASFLLAALATGIVLIVNGLV